MDPEKRSLNFIFPTKYVIPKSLKFSHWPSKIGNTSSIRVHFPASYVRLPECIWLEWKPNVCLPKQSKNKAKQKKKHAVEKQMGVQPSMR